MWYCGDALKMEKGFVNCKVLCNYAPLAYNHLAWLQLPLCAPDLAPRGPSWYLWKRVWISPCEQLWRPPGGHLGSGAFGSSIWLNTLLPDDSWFTRYSWDAVPMTPTRLVRWAWCQFLCVRRSISTYHFLKLKVELFKLLVLICMFCFF